MEAAYVRAPFSLACPSIVMHSLRAALEDALELHHIARLRCGASAARKLELWQGLLKAAGGCGTVAYAARVQAVSWI